MIRVFITFSAKASTPCKKIVSTTNGLFLYGNTMEGMINIFNSDFLIKN